MADCPKKEVIGKRTERKLRKTLREKGGVKHALYQAISMSDKLDKYGRTPKERAKDAVFGGGVMASNVAAKIFQAMDYPFDVLERNVLRPISLSMTQNLYAPAAERVVETAMRIGHIFGGAPGAARVAHLMESVRTWTAVRFIDPQLRDEFRKMMGSGAKIGAHKMVLLEDHLRYVEQPALRETRQNPLAQGMSDVEIKFAHALAHQYHNETAVSMAEKKWEQRAINKNPWVKPIWDLAKDLVRNPEKNPEFWKYSSVVQEAFRAQLEKKHETGLLDRETDAGSGLLNYLPEHDIVLAAHLGLTPKEMRDFTGFDKLQTDDPSAYQKHIRGGMMERLAGVRGKQMPDGTWEGGFPPHIIKNVDMPTLAANAELLIHTTKANQMFMKFLDNSTTTVVHRGEEIELMNAVWSHSPEWAETRAEGLDRHYVEIDSPGFIDPETRARLMVPKHVGEVLETFIGKGEQGVLKKVMTLNARLKKFKLSLSGFHHHALLMNAVVYSNKMGINPMRLMQRDEHIRLMEHPEVLEAIEKSPLTMDAPDVGINEAQIERIFKDIDGMWGKTAGRVERSIDKTLWGVLYRSVKAATFLELKGRLKKAGYSDQEAMMEAAETVNQMSGGIAWEWHGITKRARNLASLLMLAPDWQISNWTYMMKSLTGSSATAAINRSALMKYMVGAFVYGNIANKLATGHWMFENEEGERDKIALHIGGDRLYIDPFRHLFEQGRVLMGFANMIVPEEMELAEASNPNYYFPAKISALGRVGVELATGRNYWTGRSNATIYDVLGLKHETYNPKGKWRSLGEWGESTRGRFDASMIVWLKALMPISFEKSMEAFAMGESSKWEAALTATGAEAHEHWQDKVNRAREHR